MTLRDELAGLQAGDIGEQVGWVMNKAADETALLDMQKALYTNFPGYGALVDLLLSELPKGMSETVTYGIHIGVHALAFTLSELALNRTMHEDFPDVPES